MIASRHLTHVAKAYRQPQQPLRTGRDKHSAYAPCRPPVDTTPGRRTSYVLFYFRQQEEQHMLLFLYIGQLLFPSLVVECMLDCSTESCSNFQQHVRSPLVLYKERTPPSLRLYSYYTKRIHGETSSPTHEKRSRKWTRTNRMDIQYRRETQADQCSNLYGSTVVAVKLLMTDAIPTLTSTKASPQ